MPTPRPRTVADRWSHLSVRLRQSDLQRLREKVGEDGEPSAVVRGLILEWLNVPGPEPVKVMAIMPEPVTLGAPREPYGSRLKRK